MFEFGKTFNMKSVWIWITNLKPYYVFNMKSVWIVSISKGRSLLVFLRSGMHFLAVGSNIRIVALSASLGNAKDEAYFMSYWNLTKQQIDETQIRYHCFLVSWIWKGTCLRNHGSEKGHVLEIMDLKRDMSWKSWIWKGTTDWCTCNMRGNDSSSKKTTASDDESMPPHIRSCTYVVQKSCSQSYPCVLPKWWMWEVYSPASLI